MYGRYQNNISKLQPSIYFEILSITNVMDVNEEISDLEILYDGINISDKDETLKIIKIKAVNNGNVDILENHYESNLPFGFSVDSAKIVEKPTLLESNSTYITNNLNPRLDSNNRVLFNKIQFDQSSEFEIQILVIGSSNTMPSISSLGKISGISETIPIRTLPVISKKATLYLKT
jgi:hypothetical protein